MRADKPDHPPEWVSRGLKFYTLSHFFQSRFGGRVWKVSVDAGTSCPNCDGTLADQGCIFCDARSFSPSRRLGGSARSIADQVAEGTSRLRRRYGEASVQALVAYFQPSTNTYGPLKSLLPLWREAVRQPGVVGLAVGTRPDCAPDPVLGALADLQQEAWVSIEFGLQSIHQRSLDWLHRGHDFACFEDAVTRSHQRGLHVGAHLMVGLPCESREQILATAETIAQLRLDAVKLHNLYVVRDTPLAGMWERDELTLPEKSEYVQLVVDFLERLPPDCVIDRLVGDAPPDYLLAPDWCRHKAAVRHAVEEEFARRGTRQGARWASPFQGPSHRG